MLTRINLKKKNSKLISATKLGNYIKNDCIIDYLDLIDSNNHSINPIDLKLIKKRKNDKITDTLTLNKKTSFDYIVESGNKFENHIIEQIENKMRKNYDYHNLIKINERDLTTKYSLTVSTLLEKKHDIILNAVLINYENNTYGYPDLIVSGKWIIQYINDYPDELTNDRSKYYIIDVKSSTITLIDQGVNVSAKLLYNTYKTQIYIYTKALNKLFSDNAVNNNVDIGFILGKRYQYVCDKNHICNGSFDRLAIINFSNEKSNGNNLDEIIPQALKWHNELNTNWKTYTLNPINKDELYPNMKNNYDKTYKKVKKTIAHANNEITLLWNCGIKNRKLAWDAGIKKYNDPKLNCKILGFENTAKENILSNMLEILHTDSLVILKKSNNLLNWQKKLDYEFFVDFETYNSDMVFDKCIDYMGSLNSQKIYMIGVGYYLADEYQYKSFIIRLNNSTNIKNMLNEKNNLKCDSSSYIFCDNELDLINKFTDYIYNFKPKNIKMDDYLNNLRLIHWSNAEPVVFNKKLKEYELSDEKYNLKWYDLLKIFKNENNPIIIKECFGYGLKDVVKKLNEYNFFDLKWPELDDGLLSSFIARDIYNNNSSINNNIIDIVEYNYVDCIALYKIIVWMRNFIL